jgi:hypothetical protein
VRAAFNNLPAALDNGQIRLAISALRTLNYARSLAEPTLVTMNGQMANSSAGGEFPVPIVTGNTFNGLQGRQLCALWRATELHALHHGSRPHPAGDCRQRQQPRSGRGRHQHRRGSRAQP